MKNLKQTLSENKTLARKGPEIQTQKLNDRDIEQTLSEDLKIETFNNPTLQVPERYKNFSDKEYFNILDKVLVNQRFQDRDQSLPEYINIDRFDGPILKNIMYYNAQRNENDVPYWVTQYNTNVKDVYKKLCSQNVLNNLCNIKNNVFGKYLYILNKNNVVLRKYSYSPILNVDNIYRNVYCNPLICNKISPSYRQFLLPRAVEHPHDAEASGRRAIERIAINTIVKKYNGFVRLTIGENLIRTDDVSGVHFLEAEDAYDAMRINNYKANSMVPNHMIIDHRLIFSQENLTQLTNVLQQYNINIQCPKILCSTDSIYSNPLLLRDAFYGIIPGISATNNSFNIFRWAEGDYLTPHGSYKVAHRYVRIRNRQPIIMDNIPRNEQDRVVVVRQNTRAEFNEGGIYFMPCVNMKVDGNPIPYIHPFPILDGYVMSIDLLEEISERDDKQINGGDIADRRATLSIIENILKYSQELWYINVTSMPLNARRSKISINESIYNEVKIARKKILNIKSDFFDGSKLGELQMFETDDPNVSRLVQLNGTVYELNNVFNITQNTLSEREVLFSIPVAHFDRAVLCFRTATNSLISFNSVLRTMMSLNLSEKWHLSLYEVQKLTLLAYNYFGCMNLVSEEYIYRVDRQNAMRKSRIESERFWEKFDWAKRFIERMRLVAWREIFHLFCLFLIFSLCGTLLVYALMFIQNRGAKAEDLVPIKDLESYLNHQYVYNMMNNGFNVTPINITLEPIIDHHEILDRHRSDYILKNVIHMMRLDSFIEDMNSKYSRDLIWPYFNDGRSSMYLYVQDPISHYYYYRRVFDDIQNIYNSILQNITDIYDDFFYSTFADSLVLINGLVHFYVNQFAKIYSKGNIYYEAYNSWKIAYDYCYSEEKIFRNVSFEFINNFANKFSVDNATKESIQNNTQKVEDFINTHVIWNLNWLYSFYRTAGRILKKVYEIVSNMILYTIDFGWGYVKFEYIDLAGFVIFKDSLNYLIIIGCIGLTWMLNSFGFILIYYFFIYMNLSLMFLTLFAYCFVICIQLHITIAVFVAMILIWILMYFLYTNLLPIIVDFSYEIVLLVIHLLLLVTLDYSISVYILDKYYYQVLLKILIVLYFWFISYNCKSSKVLFILMFIIISSIPKVESKFIYELSICTPNDQKEFLYIAFAFYFITKFKIRYDQLKKYSFLQKLYESYNQFSFKKQKIYKLPSEDEITCSFTPEKEREPLSNICFQMNGYTFENRPVKMHHCEVCECESMTRQMSCGNWYNNEIMKDFIKFSQSYIDEIIHEFKINNGFKEIRMEEYYQKLGSKRREYIEGYQNYLDGFDLKLIFKMHSKTDEKSYNNPEQPNHKARNICAQLPMSKVLMGIVCELGMQVIHNQPWCGPGLSLKQRSEKFSKWVKEFQTNVSILCADGSAFDSTQYKIMIEEIDLYFLKKIIEENPYLNELYGLHDVERVLSQSEFLIYSKKEFLYKIQGTQMSGRMNTCLSNTLRSALYILYTMHKANIPRDWMPFEVTGDDQIIFSHLYLLYRYIEFAKKYVYHDKKDNTIHGLGQVCKVFDVYPDITGGEYLSNYLLYNPETQNVCLIRKPERFFQLIPFTFRNNFRSQRRFDLCRVMLALDICNSQLLNFKNINVFNGFLLSWKKLILKEYDRVLKTYSFSTKDKYKIECIIKENKIKTSYQHNENVPKEFDDIFNSFLYERFNIDKYDITDFLKQCGSMESINDDFQSMFIEKLYCKESNIEANANNYRKIFEKPRWFAHNLDSFEYIYC